jgi:hypothetical protein
LIIVKMVINLFENSVFATFVEKLDLKLRNRILEDTNIYFH